MDMKIVRSLVLLATLAPFVASCEVKPRSDASFIEMRGDSLLEREHNNYLSLMDGSDPATLIAEAESGIDTFVFFARHGCSHCVKMEPFFVEATKNTHRLIHVFYTDDDDDRYAAYSAALTTFQTRYGSDESAGGINGATPTLYRLNQNGASLMDIYGDNGDAKKFTSYLQSVTKTNGIYRFSEYADYVEASSNSGDFRRCLYDPTDEQSRQEYATIFQKSNAKPIYLLDYSRLNAEQKIEALASFDLESYSFTLR